MHLKLRKSVIASTLAVTLPMSMMATPTAQASPDLTNLPHLAGNAVTDPTNCVGLDNDEPVAVPYAAVAAAEELIASGAIDDDIVSALNNTDPNVTVVGPRPRALPAAAALAVAGAAWCAKGALTTLVSSTVQEIIHRVNSEIPPPEWVLSAIIGCVSGDILGVLASQTLRLKFVGAVLATVIKLRNFG